MSSFDVPPLPGDRPTAGFRQPGVPQENLLRHYAAVLRRRARWVVLGIIVGLAAGYASTLLFQPHRVGTHYYKATNTVVLNGTASEGNGGPLDQVAILVQSQDLVSAVAKQLNLTPNEVSQRLSASVRPNHTALDLTAISTDPGTAVALANTAAAALNQVAVNAANQQAAAQREALLQQISGLQNNITQLQDQLGHSRSNAAAINAQIASFGEQQAQLTTQLQQLSTATPGYTLSTITPAHAVEINARGYNYRRSQNVNAAGQVTVPDQSNAPTFNETDLSQPALESTATRLAIGGAAGLVLGILSAFLVEAWDDRLRSRARVEAITGLPVLAEIPRLSFSQARQYHVALADSPGGPLAERYRAARASVLFALEARRADEPRVPAGTSGAAPSLGGDPDSEIGPNDGKRRSRRQGSVLIVASPSAGEGKSTTTANLAAACADAGMRTLLIDGDVHRPTVGRFLAPTPAEDSPALPSPTRIEGVWYVAGPRSFVRPGETVELLERSVTRWREHFDMVLVDTPPMLTTNDATDLLPVVDAVVLVLRVGQTRTGAAERAGEVLGRLRANVLGVVLNACDVAEMEQYYGYGYSYSRGYSNSQTPLPARSDRGPAPLPGKPEAEPEPSPAHEAPWDESPGPSTDQAADQGTDQPTLFPGPATTITDPPAPDEPLLAGKSGDATGKDRNTNGIGPHPSSAQEAQPSNPSAPEPVRRFVLARPRRLHRPGSHPL